MKNILSTRYQNAVLVILLLVISALVYLPRITRIGYLNDDWYLMYSAHAYGPDVFADIFSVDRPTRALVMTPAYTLFGDNPLYYNLNAYFCRLIAGLSFLWLLQMLWPRQRSATFLIALLFLIYPGFLSQINGIDYQSQMVSLATAMLSIALSVKAALAQKPLGKVFAFLGAAVLGWLYLGLVEYFLGLELLRFGSLYLLGSRNQGSWKGKVFAGIKSWLPSLIIPAAFLVWRIFFFESVRGATDIGAQLSQFTAAPLTTGVWWLVRLFTNSLSVSFFAWGIPFYNMFGYIWRLPDLLIGFAVTGLLLLSVFWVVKFSADKQASEAEPRDWRMEAFVLGLATVVAGLIPVILVNRQADFGNYSRYALASSPGSALMLISILFSLSFQTIRWGILSILVTMSVFTHHANAIRVIGETESMRSYWWQVAWRIPQLKPDTTLVVNYPVVSIQEDYFVWGPANMIYYRDGMGGDQVRTGVSAAVLNKYSLLKILTNGGKESDNRRSILSVVDYQNVLILSMPFQGACVRVLNGAQPEISQYEEERMMVIAPYSDHTLIDLESEPHVPPQIVFGPEPPHDWCYYFEKADLARQRGDWEEVVRLGNEAFEKGLGPQDPIEWMPFLQAYARAEDLDHLDEIHSLTKNADPFVLGQVCQNLSVMPELSEAVREVVFSFYCSE